MKFAATAAAAAAILAGTPAMAQVFTLTGTRIPSGARELVDAKTFVQDGVTIITGTRIPTAAAAAITPAPTPTTLETRVKIVTPSHTDPFEEPAVDAADKKSKGKGPKPKTSTTSTSLTRLAVREEATDAPSATAIVPVETTSAPAPVLVEKRCLALGAECGDNGVYTDCCDDQLCTENHGTGSLTCGGVSV